MTHTSTITPVLLTLTSTPLFLIINTKIDRQTKSEHYDWLTLSSTGGDFFISSPGTFDSRTAGDVWLGEDFITVPTLDIYIVSPPGRKIRGGTTFELVKFLTYK